MRNKYKGTCYFCGKEVAPGQGHFERHRGRWRTIHVHCAFKQRESKKESKKKVEQLLKKYTEEESK